MVTITTIQKSNSKFARLVVAGILGTIAFNAVMYADMEITGIPLDIVSTMGSLVIGESEYTEIVGHAIHFANGIGLALLFGYVALPISKKIIKLPVIVYAIVFAIVELVVAVWFAMLPILGAGIAGLNIGPEVSAMTFVRHVAFGIVIGFVMRGKTN